ncbi:MAG: hypothetical protein ABII07_01445 [Patescibacteria group bacterium]|nr:hypothetical protein [Patescibacteria group bacterium]
MKTIKLIDLLKVSTLSSRRAIKYIFDEFKPNKKDLIVLDFEGIDFMSRSAAHELLCYKEKLSLEFSNMSNSPAEVLRAVAASRAYPKPIESFKAKRISASTLFS